MKSLILKLNSGLTGDSHFKVLLKGSSVTLILKIVGALSSYVFTLLVTRNFGASAMGTFALSLTVITIFSVVGRLGLDTALLKLISEHSSQGRWDTVRSIHSKALRMSLPLSFLLSVLLFFCSPPIATYVFHKEGLVPFLRLASFGIIPTVLIFLNSESLRGLKEIRDYAFLQLTGVFLFGALLLGTALTIWEDNRLPLIAYLAASVIVATIGSIMFVKKADVQASSASPHMGYRELFDISMPMLLSSSMFLVMGWADTIMLGIFRSEREVGIFSVALKISTVTSLTLMAINSIAAPKFAELYSKGDMDGLQGIVRQSTRMIFWTSVPVLLCILLFPKIILGIFGEEFEAGVYALLLLAAGQFVNAISGSVGYLLQMTGNQKLFRNIILIAVVINIALNALLIQRYGINGAAVSSMISMIFWNLAAVFSIKKLLGLRTYYFPYIDRFCSLNRSR